MNGSINQNNFILFGIINGLWSGVQSLLCTDKITWSVINENVFWFPFCLFCSICAAPYLPSYTTTHMATAIPFSPLYVSDFILFVIGNPKAQFNKIGSSEYFTNGFKKEEISLNEWEDVRLNEDVIGFFRETKGYYLFNYRRVKVIWLCKFLSAEV